ncbi:autotransporter assembly complex family protein [Pseudooceanicola sp. LIPI14-2-Ac024]|uniref:autotransporter assembly complex protein TamA n=1 Tax=Pseudooceanicola sp. LIPI14-2-Ac024 TaxID=3344875 RepID=UPI0035D03636
MICTLLAALAALFLAPLAALATEATLVAPTAPSDLRSSLESKSRAIQAVEEGTVDPQELIASAQADYARMVGVLYEYGYFGGYVSIKVDGREASEVSALRRTPRVDRIVIEVAPGPLFRFSEAGLTPLPQGIRPVDGYARGEVATTPIIREAANQGVDDWREAGHAKAEVSDQDITADHRNNSVRSRIGLAPGPYLVFGRSVLTQQSRDSNVRAERILAIAGIPSGEQFSPQEVRDAQRRLRETGAFRSAVVEEAETPNPDGTLDMIVDVEDTLPRRFGFGVELSNIDGLALNAYWMHRNIFGGAERLRIDGDVAGIGGTSGGLGGSSSGVDYSVTLQLGRPAFLAPDNELQFNIKLEHLDEPSYTSDLAEATVGVHRYFNEYLSGTLAGGFRFSTVDDAYGEREFYHILGRGDVTYDRRNDQLDPTRGYYADLNATPFIGVSGSETGVRLYGDLRGYVPLGSDRFTLAGRLQIGNVQGASLEGTPPDFLFFSGGGGTVRGQDYQSLGGGTIGGEDVGGQSFVGVSAELRAKITDTIGAVAFVDYGYVSASNDFSGGDDHAGAGIGGRYYTPIGPIRFDVAVPISGESGWGVYVGIGQAF